MKPFRFGDVVPAEYQCPRPDLLRTITGHLRAGQKVLLQGERRMGKTSFVRYVVAPETKARMFSVSLWGVKSVDEFTRQCLRGLQQVKEQSSVLRKMGRALNERLAPSVQVAGIGLTLQPTAALGLDVLETVLDELYREHKKEPVFAFWDEFQEVLKLKDADTVLGRFRGAVQHQSGMAHLFAGSDRNRMHEIFNHPKSPLFKGAATVEFDQIPDQDFARWITAQFRRGKVSVMYETVAAILDVTDRISGDVQQLCAALWDLAKPGDTIDNATLEKAYALVWAGESRSYEYIVQDSTELQLRCLTLLASEPSMTPTGGDFVRASGARSGSSVMRALNRYVAQAVLVKRGPNYFFSNPFFRLWLAARAKARGDQV